MRETKTFGSLADGIAHAKLYGGRIATHHNSHEVTWFSMSYMPSDILRVGTALDIDTFGPYGSF